MACIEIKNLAGEVKVIPENTPYGPAWKFTGGISWDCEEEAKAASATVEAQLAEQAIKWGDAIAWVTKKLGVNQCTPCKARQEILNHASEKGWSQTIKEIKETF